MNITYNSNNENKLTFAVPDTISQIDVRTFLRKHCNISARTLSKLKRTTLGITCNSKLLKTTDVLHSGDIVVLSLPDDTNDIIAIPGELNILYEDNHILIIDKPGAMPVHPTKIHQLDTLANIVSFYMKQKGESYTFRAINRLDRDTSGCVIVAKDRYTAAALPKSVTKEYIAACKGYISSNGTVDKPIKVMEGRSIQRVVADDGVRSVTHYYPIYHSNNHTLTRFVLETGRTHQIRCHMSYIGHPLAGDDMYGGSLDFIGRQALHCRKVKFVHPVTGKDIEVVSEIPSDILSVFNCDECEIPI